MLYDFCWMCVQKYGGHNILLQGKIMPCMDVMFMFCSLATCSVSMADRIYDSCTQDCFFEQHWEY